MAQLFRNRAGQQPSGKLIIKEEHPNFNNVYFVPSKENLEIGKLNSSNPTKYKKHILDINCQDDYISIYPIDTRYWREEFLEAKYEQLESITLKGFDFELADDEDGVIELLSNLPSAFIKDYNYGLGLQKDYRFIIYALEELGIKHLVISKKEKTNIDISNSSFTIEHNEFDIIRKGLNKIVYQSRNITSKTRQIAAYNFLAGFLNNEKYIQKQLIEKGSPLEREIAKSSPIILLNPTKIEQEDAIKFVSKNKKIIAKENPQIISKLRSDIELVTLEELIESYENNLNKKLPENFWQKLFNENPFVLSMSFGFPIIKIKDQASIGGNKLSGKGTKITDFLVKNKLTNNLGLFEIKTPSTKILNRKPYRDGVYIPSSDLSGSLNQVIDQKRKLQTEIAQIKNNSRIYDIETFSVNTVLVIGKLPIEPDEKKSFEMFRGNSKNVVIITFDELLEKLKQLHNFLQISKENNI